MNPLHSLLMQTLMAGLHTSEDVIPFPFDGRAIGAELMIKPGSLDHLLAQSNQGPSDTPAPSGTRHRSMLTRTSQPDTFSHG